MKFALFTAAASLAFVSCTSTSVMGLSKASYVDGELEKLNTKTEEMDRLKDRFAEWDALSDQVADLNASMDEAERADEELRNLADEFRDRLDGLSKETLQELVQVLMEHLESGEE